MNKNEIKKASVQASRTMDGFVDTSRTPRVRPRPDAIKLATHVPVSDDDQAITAVSQPAKPTAPVYYPLPAYQAPDRPTKPYKKRRSKKVLALRGASLLLALFLATGGFLTWKGYSRFHKVFHGTATVAALTEKKVAPYQLNGEGDGRVNILLLGVTGPGHRGTDLTSTMAILSVDPVNNSAVLLNIPHDLWVKLPVSYYGSSQKINAVYENGKYAYLKHVDMTNDNAAAVQSGFAADDQVLQSVLGITIQYHILLNLQAFQQAIDTVGGVTVNVPTPLVDQSLANENNGNPVLAAAGPQVLNGARALQYVRSSQTTSDLDRTQRQQQVLAALTGKLLSAGTYTNPAKIDSLIDAFGDNVYSDMSSQGAVRLLDIMRQVGSGKLRSISLSDPNYKLVTADHIGTTAIIRPTAGLNNYTAIQSYIRANLPDGYLVHERAPVAVVGLSSSDVSNTASMLSDYGYDIVSATVNNQTAGSVAVVDLGHGQDPYTRHYLEQRFGVQAETKLPPGISLPDPTAKFVIID